MENPKNINAIVGNYKNPVLIVEDKLENQALLKGLCRKINVKSETAENGRIALDMVRKTEFAVYIVDMMMPVMDGRTFIIELKKIVPDAVIIVQTALDSAETIIEIMKMGVFDYIIKPIEPEIFNDILLKALDYNYLREFEKQQSLSAAQKIRSQIDWLNYKESRRITDKDTAETKSIYSVKTSLAQGAGFGVLITLVDMLHTMKRESGDDCIVPKDLMNLLFENNDYCRTQLDGLNYATSIMEKNFDLREGSASELVSMLPTILERILPYFEARNIKITYPELKNNAKIKFNDEIIKLIIEEILINAYKFTLNNTTVNIISKISEGYFWISVKNAVKEKPYGGVPPKFEKLVLEPFFRMNPPDESIAKIEVIGFGLGLAVVDYVAKKHGGMFFIHDVVDMTAIDKQSCTMAELLLPIL